MGDHRVEPEALVFLADRPEGAVGGHPDRTLGGRRVLALGQSAGVGIARLPAVRVERQRPDPVEEAVDAADAGGAPRSALVPGAHEHEEEPHMSAP